MSDLQPIEQSIALNGVGHVLATMTPEKIAVVAERMVEIDRSNQTLGRSNTQHTNQLMTLNMLSASPYRRLRQCLSQIESRRNALEASYFKYRRKLIEIEEWEKEDTPLNNLLIQEAHYFQERHKMYIDGALKELATFQQAYEDIRINNNIPENWDEKDAENDEIGHHIKQVFRQSYRDMCLTGRITQGNAEYLEQHGVQLQVAMRCVAKYIADCEEMMNEGENPNIRHFYEWLDEMVEIFKDEWKLVVEEMGLSTIIRDEFLYLEEGKV